MFDSGASKRRFPFLGFEVSRDIRDSFFLLSIHVTSCYGNRFGLGFAVALVLMDGKSLAGVC